MISCKTLEIVHCCTVLHENLQLILLPLNIISLMVCIAFHQLAYHYSTCGRGRVIRCRKARISGICSWLEATLQCMSIYDHLSHCKSNIIIINLTCNC